MQLTHRNRNFDKFHRNRNFDKNEGALDQLRPALRQHLDGDAVGDLAALDQELCNQSGTALLLGPEGENK